MPICLAETVLEVLYGFVCKTAGKNYKSWVAKVRCMTNTENKKLIGDLILTWTFTQKQLNLHIW